MEIRINASAADITLDKEKTVGEVMAALQEWLEASGHRLSGISVDGTTIDISKLDEIFSRDVETVKTIDLKTSSLADLSVESLMNLLSDAGDFEKLNFNERSSFVSNWKESPQVHFVKEQMPDLFNLFVNSFSGGEINTGMLVSITEERLREINDPALEISNLKQIVEETCSRLNDLALDIQTGKDKRAAESIQIFSGVAEKILRIIRQMDIQGFLSQNTGAEKPLNMIIIEFGKLVKELLEAYEKHDTVLVGDIAEYEASVKLKELYIAISAEPAASQVKK